MSERHNILRRDDRGRLHSLAGPACAYPDGWAIYAVHGVRVPAWIIEKPREITPEKIDAETNAEIRRVMIDILGAEKYLANCKPIAQDEFGELFRKEVKDDEPIVMVKVLNSTPEPDNSIKTYFLRVPPTIQTPHAGIAWTFGMTPETYLPICET